MKITNLIKVLIVVFAVLAAVNIGFSLIASNANNEKVAARDLRRELTLATTQFREDSLMITRHARTHIVWSYAPHGGSDDSYRLYWNLVDNDRYFVGVLQAFKDSGAPSGELELLDLAVYLSEQLRALEARAFAALQANDYPLAISIMFGEESAAYRLYETQLTLVMDLLSEAMYARTEAIVAASEQRASVFETHALIATILLALTSVAGALYLLRKTNAAIKREEASQEMRRALIDSMPMFLEFWDEELNMVDCSDQTFKTFGLSSREEYIRRAYEFQPELQPCGTPSREKTDRYVAQTLEDGVSRSEWLHIAPDGELFPAEVVFVRVQVSDKILVVGYSKDLREVKAAMQREREAHELNEFFLRSVPLSISLWDEDCNLISINDQTAQLLEVPSKEHYTEHFLDLCPEYQPDGSHSVEKGIKYIKEAFRTGGARFEWMHRTLSGESIPCDVTLVRFQHKGRYMVASYTSDLRHIKATMAQVAEAEERFQLMLNAAPISVCLYDKNRKPIECNDMAPKMLGLHTQEQFLEGFSVFMPKCQPDGQDSFEQMYSLIDEALREGRSESVFHLVRADGGEIVVQSTFVRVRYRGELSVIEYMSDLTEIRAAAKAEREAYKMTQLVLNAAPFVIDVFDEELNLIETSGQSAELFGVKSKEEYIQRFYDLSPELQPCGTPSREKAEALIQKAFMEGRAQFEWMHCTLDGEPLPTEVTLVRFARSGDLCVLGYTVDLRAIKAAALKEREALDYARMLLDASPMLIEIWDEECRPIDCNQQLLDMFGLANREEYIAQYDNLSPKLQPCGSPSRELSIELAQKSIALGFHRYEWTHQLPDGSLLPVEVIDVCIERDGKPIVVGYTHDLRDVKRAMAKATAAEERARLLVEASPIACLLLDADYNTVACNHATLNLFIVRPGKRLEVSSTNGGKTEICESNCEQCKHRRKQSCVAYRLLMGTGDFSLPLHTGDRASSLCEKISALYREDPKQRVYTFEHDFVTMYGENIACEVTTVSVTYREQKAVACYLRDIREEKLRVMAEEESRAKTRFLAHMSHEIRTPMNAVLGITEIQLQRGGLTPEIEEAFLHIHSSSSLLLAIINDILDLSKVEAGKMEIVPEVYEVASMVVDTVQLNLMQIGSKKINFNLSVSENMPTHLIGDELRIKQILNNLLSNAIKYTGEGSVSLELGIDVPDPANGDAAVMVIVVKDTGQGMTEAQLRSVFESEFTRFNTKLNRTVEGTGLGMSITRRLIDMMQGNVEVESYPGEGTTFTIHLPQKAIGRQVLGKEAVETLANLKSAQQSLKRMVQLTRDPMPYGRVLAVDDVESNLYVIRGLLQPYKIRVETASSGSEAVEKVKSGQVYDIIFMDHMMPGMDGLDATKIIRSLGYEHPILALTANTLKGAQDLFMNNGFTGFIAKPIDIYKLNALLVRYIRDKYPPEVTQAAKHTGAGAQSPLPGISVNGLAQSFLRDAAKATDILQATIEGGVYDSDSLHNYTIYVHAMKSALHNIGRPNLSALAHTLENAGREEDAHTIQTLTPRFIRELRDVMLEFEASCRNKDMPDTDDNPQAVREGMLAIHAACESYDISAADAALASLMEQPCSGRTAQLLERISAFLLRGEIEEAAELAQRGAHDISGSGQEVRG